MSPAPRRGSTIVLRLISLFALAAAVVLAAPVQAEAGKLFAADVTPHAVAGGTSLTFHFKLTNEASTQTLGSANVTVPSPLVATGVTSLSPPATATLTGNLVKLRTLGIKPGGSLTVDIQASVPCGTTGATWLVAAKQSNNFNGPPGNDFILDAANSDLFTSISNCSLVFTAHPANAEVGANISSTDYDPDGPPVTVEVRNGSGATATSWSTPISLGIANNPGGGTLSGNTTVAPSNGVATFDTLSIDRHGEGYTLRATSDGAEPAESTAFDIVDVADQCDPPASCSGFVESDTTSARVDVTPTSSGTLVMSLGTSTLDCDGYDEPTSDVLRFSYDGSGFKIVTYTVKIVDRPLLEFEACYASPNQFLDENGMLTNKGLLPECPPLVPPELLSDPCLLSRTLEASGAVLRIFAPDGDPQIH